MLKTFQYRIYPNHPEQRTMENVLATCRTLYNRLLETRRNAWKNEGVSLSTRDTQDLLPLWKKDDPQLKNIYSQVLQNVNERVGIAFDGFFSRVRAGEAAPGYPRFKSHNRYDSFTYPQYTYAFKTKAGEVRQGYAFHVEGEGKKAVLHMAKLGAVKIVLHRPLSGSIKTLTVKREPTGKWFASIVCEVVPAPLPAINKWVGIDLGLHHYMATSDGKLVENPRFFRREQKALAKAQRKYSAVLEQSKKLWAKGETVPLALQNERHRLGKVACRVHERIGNKRKNFCHQLSRDMVDDYDHIVLEILTIKGMSESNRTGLNKSIRDAAWGMTRRFILSKAAEAGRECIQVHPHYTSQRCSGCNVLVPKDLGVRTHKCPHCGLVLDRDINAALNILALGMQGAGNQAPEAPA